MVGTTFTADRSSQEPPSRTGRLPIDARAVYHVADRLQGMRSAGMDTTMMVDKRYCMHLQYNIFSSR